MGIATGIDLDAMIAAGHLAERVLGRTLPSALLRGGSLTAFRARAASCEGVSAASAAGR
jgi:hydroxymethylglutaryl-CoA lyase